MKYQSWSVGRVAYGIYKYVLLAVYSCVAFYGCKFIGPSHEAAERIGLNEEFNKQDNQNKNVYGRKF